MGQPGAGTDVAVTRMQLHVLLNRGRAFCPGSLAVGVKPAETMHLTQNFNITHSIP